MLIHSSDIQFFTLIKLMYQRK